MKLQHIITLTDLTGEPMPFFVYVTKCNDEANEIESRLKPVCKRNPHLYLHRTTDAMNRQEAIHEIAFLESNFA